MTHELEFGFSHTGSPYKGAKCVRGESSWGWFSSAAEGWRGLPQTGPRGQAAQGSEERLGTRAGPA